MIILIKLILFPIALSGLLLTILLLLLIPLRILSLQRLPREIRSGKVPHSLQKTGSVPWLMVGALPYPGRFDRSNRSAYNLNGPWGFRLDPRKKGMRKKWYRKDNRKTVQEVPSCFNSAESGLTDYTGTIWYWKEFQLTEKELTDRDRFFYRLCFEGILLRGQVWLNGRSLGHFDGGYTGIFFDLSGNLKTENLLAVRCSNKLKKDSLPPKLMQAHNPGWHTYGGIYRDVRIEKISRSYIVKILSENEYLTKNQMQLKISVLTCGGGEKSAVQLTLKNPDNHPVRGRLLEKQKDRKWPETKMQSHTFTFRLKNPCLWSPENLRYYTLETCFHGDRVNLDLGIRTLEVSPESLKLNDQKLFLKGISRHEDHPRLGATESPSLIREDLDLIQGMHANYIRLAHYPHDRKFLAAAEKRGLFCSQELPLYQCGMGFLTWLQERRPLCEFPLTLAGIRHLSRRKLLLNARRQLIEMIERDRHRPSLLFWSLGNENYTLGRRSGRIFRWLKEVAREYDPSRPVSVVEVTYRMDMLDKRKRGWEGADILSVNSYYGWYYGKPEDLKRYLEKIRLRWPGRPLILSEYGAGAAPDREETDGYWKAERVYFKRTYSEEYQEQILKEYWNQARDFNWICGVSPWVLCDFYNVWFPDNPIPNYNLKGVCSAYRIPKKGWNALKSLYEREENK